MGLEVGTVGKSRKGLSLSGFFLWGLRGWHAEVSYLRAKSDLGCAELLRLGKHVESRRSLPVQQMAARAI